MGRMKSGLEEGRGEIELWIFQSSFVISKEGAARCGRFMCIRGEVISVLLLVILKAILLADAEGIGEDEEGVEEEG